MLADIGVRESDAETPPLDPEDPAFLEPPGRAAFVEAYFGAEPPPWSKDLDWFVAGALLERLHRMMRRSEAKWAPKVVPLLDEIERTLATSP